MLAIFAPVVAFLLREAVAKFVIFAGVFGLVAVLVPVAIGYILPWLGASSFSSAFSSVSPGVWFFLDFFQLSFGLPLLVSAWITRFVVRRLPLVG